MNVGIDHIATSVPCRFLPLRDLARARNVDEAKFVVGIGVHEMAVPSPCEDVVVLAANAGRRVLTEADVSPGEVGLLIVGTESAEDRAKPTATHVHRLLDISSSCRVYDITHACVGATYGLLSALDWVRQSNNKYALVIASDIARYGLNTPGEPTQGAGAVALLVSRDPRLLAVQELSKYSASVYDFWKPLDEQYPIVKGVYSVQCYLNAVKSCFSQVPIDADAAFVYHTPYPKMVEKAHAEVASLLGKSDWRLHYTEKVQSSNVFPSRVGNTYTASLWLALVSLLEIVYDAAVAENITPVDAFRQHNGIYLFSYGSGCGAVLMHGQLMDSWPSMVRQFQVGATLKRRQSVTVAEYERLFTAVPSPKEIEALDGSEFVFLGTVSKERQYASRQVALKRGGAVGV